MLILLRQIAQDNAKDPLETNLNNKHIVILRLISSILLEIWNRTNCATENLTFPSTKYVYLTLRI